MLPGYPAGVAATSPPYPTLGWATTQVYPAREATDRAPRAGRRPPRPRGRVRPDQDPGRLRLAVQCRGHRSGADRGVGRGRVHRPPAEPGLGGTTRCGEKPPDPGHRPACLCAGLSGAVRDQRLGIARLTAALADRTLPRRAAVLRQVRLADPRRVRLRPSGTDGIAPGGELALQADQRPQRAVDGTGDEHRFRGVGRVHE